MTKAIFVLETMPKSCAECKYIIYGDYKNKAKGHCILNDKRIDHYNDIDTMRADICQLKPVPLKASCAIIRSKYTEGLKDGWNDLIDYLLVNNSKLLNQDMPAEVLLSKAEDYLAEEAIDAAEASFDDEEYADILEKDITVKREFLNKLYEILRGE